MRVLVLALAMAALCGLASAQVPEFSAGRPGATESPIPVPKGYWQAETEIAAYSRTWEPGGTATETRAAGTTLRYGLAPGTDVELIVAPYARAEAAGDDALSGFGDVTLRARRRIADGKIAAALIGYVTLPTAREGLGAEETEGGLIATAAGPLGNGFSWTLTGGLAAIHDGGYRGEISGAANLTCAFSERVGGYVEIAASRAALDSETSASGNLGITLMTNAVTQLDAGVNLGISGSAPDAEFFVGWAHRF